MKIKNKAYIKVMIKNIIFALSFGQILPSNLPTNISALGELLTVESTPIIQLQYPYNSFNPNYVLTNSSNGGSVDVTGTNLATLTSGTTAGGSATLWSKGRLPYQSSQGSSSVFSTIFTAGTSGCSQQIGLGNFTTYGGTIIQDGFFFGYFNGTSYNYSGIVDGVYTGTTFGIMHTCNGSTCFYPQSEWNQDSFNGAGASGISLDTTKGNVYKIQYQWLGFGVIKFFIENPISGVLTLVHMIEYPNTNIATSLLQPTMQLVAQVVNSSGGGSGVVLKNPFFAGFIQGKINTNRDTRYTVSNSTSVYAIPNNAPTFNHVLSIQNGTVFNGINNQVIVSPDWVSLINTVNNSEVMFTFFLNPSYGTTPTFKSFSTIFDTTTSVMNFSSSGSGTGSGYGNVSTVTAGLGSPLFSVYLVGNSSLLFSLSDINLQLQPNDVLCIAATRISGRGAVLAAISWLESF